METKRAGDAKTTAIKNAQVAACLVSRRSDRDNEAGKVHSISQ